MTSSNNLNGHRGFNKEKLQLVTGSMAGYVERGEVSGVVTLVYRKGEIAHLDVLGKQGFESNLPMQRDTIFRIFSMSKPVGIAAVLTLVEENRLNLDDPVEEWLPELANRQVLRDPAGPLSGEVNPSPRPITLRDLLTYRAGIGWLLDPPVPYDTFTMELLAYPLSLLLTKSGLTENFTNLDPNNWMKLLEDKPLRYAPGERWLYNTPSDILGVLIARVSGLSLGEYLKQRIFEPLGMKDTGFWVPEDKLHRLAAGYVTSTVTNQRVLLDEAKNSAWDQPPLFESGGGGLVSTIDDYLQFCRMLLNKGRLGNIKVLAPRTVEAMTTDYLTPSQRTHSAFGQPDYWKNQGFGFGLSIITGKPGAEPGPNVGSYSWGGALGTNWLNDPAEEMITMMMIQQSNPQLKIEQDFRSLVYRALED